MKKFMRRIKRSYLDDSTIHRIMPIFAGSSENTGETLSDLDREIALSKMSIHGYGDIHALINHKD